MLNLGIVMLRFECEFGNFGLFDNIVAVVSPFDRIRSNSEGVVAGAEKRGKGREKAPHKKVDADAWGRQVGNFLMGSSKYVVTQGRSPQMKCSQSM